MEVPDLLKLSAWEGVKALDREERRRGVEMRDLYAPLLRSFREQLRRAFLGHFVTQPSTEPAAPPVTVWDPLILTDPDAEFPDIDQLTNALVEESDGLIEENLDEAMDDGHRRELWVLSQGGIDTAPDEDSLPNRERRAGLLLIGGVAGLSWRERLVAAGRDHRTKARRWLLASVRSGRSFPETLDGIERIGDQFTNRVIGLQGNEMFRAYGSGAAIARDAAKRDHDITEVWVTREDKIVCPICEDLHLTVTLKQPVTDSHPRCRCVKVPVPAGFIPTAKTFADFQRELGNQSE